MNTCKYIISPYAHLCKGFRMDLARKDANRIAVSIARKMKIERKRKKQTKLDTGPKSG